MSRESKNKRMKFVVYLNDKFLNTSIDELELSARSSNCLRRAGIFTIGELVQGIERQEDLLKYRNLGNNSANEIMRKIFQYHFEHLSDQQRTQYQKRVAALNNRDNFQDCLMLGGRYYEI